MATGEASPAAAAMEGAQAEQSFRRRPRRASLPAPATPAPKRHAIASGLDADDAQGKSAIDGSMTTPSGPVLSVPPTATSAPVKRLRSLSGSGSPQSASRPSTPRPELQRPAAAPTVQPPVDLDMPAPARGDIHTVPPPPRPASEVPTGSEQPDVCFLCNEDLSVLRNTSSDRNKIKHLKYASVVGVLGRKVW